MQVSHLESKRSIFYSKSLSEFSNVYVESLLLGCYIPSTSLPQNSTEIPSLLRRTEANGVQVQHVSQERSRNPLPDYEIVVQTRSRTKIERNKLARPVNSKCYFGVLNFACDYKGAKTKWQMIDLYHHLQLKSRMTQRNSSSSSIWALPRCYNWLDHSCRRSQEWHKNHPSWFD
ncbi:hypothetical protein PIB30_035314 [Stylosanthes scabra]|uniref:Uncharacterized protein n=1 Tax=Stylosanthes scabra TaxID=79078 RepID=A0ABU6RD67_9FABA|nr:hypothetical protein [Stylosanthes scabra]